MSDLTASAQHTDAGAPGGTQTGTGTPPAQSEAPKATLTQEQFNAALAEEKRKWKQAQEAQVAEAARKAAEAEAAAKGEFEKLANERATRLAQLEAEHTTAAERITAYEAEMERQFKARLKALPEEIREMDPGGDMLTRFAWLPKAEAAAVKLNSTAPTRPPLGTPPGPRGAGQSTTVHSTDIVSQKRGTNDYAL